MRTVTGLFDRHEDAVTAVHELEAFGVPPDDLSLVAKEPDAASADADAVRRGGTLLRVRLPDGSRAASVEGIMQQHGAVGPDAGRTQRAGMGWSPRDEELGRAGGGEPDLPGPSNL